MQLQKPQIEAKTSNMPTLTCIQPSWNLNYSDGKSFDLEKEAVLYLPTKTNTPVMIRFYLKIYKINY